jgi:hypothetical protein
MKKMIIIFGFLLVFVACKNEIKPETDADNLKPVLKQLEAYNNRDIDEFAKWFSEDVELITLKTNEVFCHGREQLVKLYGDMFSKSPDLHCEIVNRITCGNIIIDEEEVTGIRGGEFVHATAIYEVEEGIIVRAWFTKE